MLSSLNRRSFGCKSLGEQGSNRNSKIGSQKGFRAKAVSYFYVPSGLIRPPSHPCRREFLFITSEGKVGIGSRSRNTFQTASLR